MGRRDLPAVASPIGEPIAAPGDEDNVDRLRTRIEELERANRAKDRMLAVMGHELRSPLNAILGWTQRLRTEELDAERRERALETIERNANAQWRLLEQILDASRLSADRLKLVLAPIDLGAVVERAVEGFLPASTDRSLSLTCRAAEGIVVLADRERIEQVVANLVANALKYTPANGHVTVTVMRDGGLARLIVVDDGTGIAPELLPHVFDLYVQDETPAARTGLGLGLHIVKQIVDRHGGVASAASAGEGRGATFTVRLPLHEGSASGTREKTTP